MSKITPEDLEKIKERMTRTANLRDGNARAKVTVHMGTCGIAAGARKIMATLLELIEAANTKDVIVTSSGCAGLCSREPMITVEIKDNAPVKYVELDEEKTRRIFAEHVSSGVIVKEYALAVGSERIG
jgi:NADP-reducing hydrogenase subunit HndB